MASLVGCLLREASYMSAGLASGEMHDSHEFFISLTTLLHQTSTSCSADAQCGCVVHGTFGGLWCSGLVCTASECGYVFSTVDTFLEINLQPRKEGTVEEALKEYMRSEPMPDHKCTCCRGKHCNKHMTIHTLPATLCLHLKRFEAETDEKEKEKAESRSPPTQHNKLFGGAVGV